MKKIFAGILALCLLFSGCGVIKETDEVGDYVPVSKNQTLENEHTFRVQKSAVYFHNESSDTLTAEIRNLMIKQDENPAKAAIEQLLEGPYSNSELVGIAPNGMSLSSIEFSREIANIYLDYDGEEFDPKQKFTLELAIANTVADILGATYVSFLYNGVSTGIKGFVSPPLEKQTGSINEMWIQAEAAYVKEEPQVIEEEILEVLPEPSQEPVKEVVEELPTPIDSDITTILYFVSADGGYILPEARKVTYTDDKYIEAIIDELKKGPNDTSAMKGTLSFDLKLLEEPVFVGNTVKLDFSKRPTINDFSDSDYLLSYASMIYTITGFVPNVKNIDISILGQPITEYDNSYKFFDGMQRTDFNMDIGSSAPIYFNDENSDLLLEVQRSMEQSEIWSAKKRVQEIFRGPLRGEAENTETVIFSDMTIDDVLSVYAHEDAIYIDLSNEFVEACQGISPRSEMLLVYSIVNTLTSMNGANKVQFLVEGKQTKTLSGTLCLSDPLLKNYGIIK